MTIRIPLVTLRVSKIGVFLPAGLMSFSWSSVSYAASPSPVAVSQPLACISGTSYSTYNRRPGYAPTTETSYQVAGPGTIGYTVTDTASQTFGVDSSVTVSASAIIATAEATAGVNYSYTTSVSRAWSYTTTIPAGRTGQMAVFHAADAWGVDKIVDLPTCNSETTTNITAVIPLASTANTTFCVLRDFYPYRTAWQSTCSGE